MKTARMKLLRCATWSLSPASRSPAPSWLGAVADSNQKAWWSSPPFDVSQCLILEKIVSFPFLILFDFFQKKFPFGKIFPIIYVYFFVYSPLCFRPPFFPFLFWLTIPQVLNLLLVMSFLFVYFFSFSLNCVPLSSILVRLSFNSVSHSCIL